MSNSLAEIIAELPEEERQAIYEGFTEEQLKDMAYDWSIWGRPEQMPPDDDSWHIFLALAGRGWGKLESIDTPIPTPDGWKLLGDIKTGDRVFDEYGKPCNVVYAHPIQYPKKAYKLTFSDGSQSVCGSEHLWTTWTHSDRKSYNRRNEYNNVDDSVGLPKDWATWSKPTRWGHPSNIGPKTRTTQEIVDTFTQGKRGDLNHSIPVLAAPLQYSKKKLPIDPYVYTAWLGDGSSNTSNLTSHIDESDWLVSMFADRGYTLRLKTQDKDSKTGQKKNCNTLVFNNLRRDLKIAGVHDNKNILDIYRYGSIQQRRDALAGFLDTDGFVDKSNQYVEFCSMRRDHAEFVQELAMSLGQKPRTYEGEATFNGKSYGTKYRVQWRPTENFFYMPRKAEVFRPLNGQASRTMHRMISAFEEVPAVPMRCLAVDSKNHLFLRGKEMIPNHNSRAGAEWVRKKVETAEAKGEKIEVLLLGRTSADVRDVMVKAILECSHPDNMPEYIPSKRRLQWPGGSYALCTSSEKPDQLRGPSAHYAWADELAALKATTDDSGATAWSNLLAATREGKNPQIFGTTTPKRTPLMKDLVKQSEEPKRRIKMVKGSTFDNSSLSAAYIQSITEQYGNSDLAKQELYGEMLLDAEGLFFTEEMINAATVDPQSEHIPHLPLRYIAVDPSVAERPGDECGIMAVGVTGEAKPSQRTAYILEDYSIKASADIWVKRVVEAAKHHRTKYIVVEGNQGQQLLQLVLNAEDPSLKVFLVNASHGKHKRAEPVIVAMQQKRVKIVGSMPDLTDQMTFFDPENTKSSPDRMDAMVWGVIAGLIDPPKGLRVIRSNWTSSENLKLPQGRGTGRARSRPAMGGNRGSRGRGGSRM